MGRTPAPVPPPTPVPAIAMPAAATPPGAAASSLARAVRAASADRATAGRRFAQSHAADGSSRAATAVIGWILVDSPVDVRVYANGRLLGSATNARYRLPAGRHTITLVNEQQGIRSVQPVQITSGATVRVTASAPVSE